MPALALVICDLTDFNPREPQHLLLQNEKVGLDDLSLWFSASDLISHDIVCSLRSTGAFEG